MSERPSLGIAKRQRLLFAGGLALVVVAVAAAMLAFLWPSESRSFDLGPLDQFTPGTVTTYNLRDGVPVLSPDRSVLTNRAFHIVRLVDGEIRALSSKDPHLGCAVPWRPDFEWDGKSGWFRNPCHGEIFDLAGNRVFGPSPRGLDRFAIEIEDGRVVVDLGDLTLGPPGSRPSSSGGAPATVATGTATATPAATAPPPPDDSFPSAAPAEGSPFGSADLIAALAERGLTYDAFQQPGCPSGPGGSTAVALALDGPLPGEGPVGSTVSLWIYSTSTDLDAEWTTAPDGTLISRAAECDYHVIATAILRNENLLMMLGGGTWATDESYREIVVGAFEGLTP